MAYLGIIIRNHMRLLTYHYLGGGFKYVLFSPLFGEDFQFDDHIFQRGLFNHQPVMIVP